MVNLTKRTKIFIVVGVAAVIAAIVTTIVIVTGQRDGNGGSSGGDGNGGSSGGDGSGVDSGRNNNGTTNPPSTDKFKVQSVATDWASEFPSYAMPDQTFHKKFVNVQGFPVAVSNETTDEVLKIAAKWTDVMLSFADPSVRDRMIEKKGRLVILGPIGQESIDQVPETAGQGITPDERGIFISAFQTSIAGTEDLLCNDARQNYGGNCIMIHELAHHMHLSGASDDMLRRIEDAFRNAEEKNLWDGSYARTNHIEYFAEGVMSYFDCNRYRFPDSMQHVKRETRPGFYEHDPTLAGLVEEFFRGNTTTYTCPNGKRGRVCEDRVADCPARKSEGECNMEVARSRNNDMFFNCAGTCDICTGTNA